MKLQSEEEFGHKSTKMMVFIYQVETPIEGKIYHRGYDLPDITLLEMKRKEERNMKKTFHFIPPHRVWRRVR